jgi:hypothetical protein
MPHRLLGEISEHLENAAEGAGVGKRIADENPRRA